MADRIKILDEFVALTGYHRKHAIRVLREEASAAITSRAHNRVYDEAVRQALTMLWEAADRVCGKRLKALIPSLVEAMERHGHLDLDPVIKTKVLQISAATIDRVLAATRLHIDGQRKRRSGVDSDNDSAFMSQSVFDYCKAHGLEQTRSRAYKKNDQAWVEQKNGAIVRRLVGYGRLSGIDATRALAKLYASSRLYINFFQPSFKLKSKSRDGARVQKVYFTPATPCDRLLAHSSVEPAIKEKLKAQFKCLDPVRRLQEIRHAQQALSDLAAHGVHSGVTPAVVSDLADFAARLACAWKTGDARPTHRARSGWNK